MNEGKPVADTTAMALAQQARRAREAAGLTLAVQIRCVGRELGMRRSTYPKWVKSGRMTQETADHELAAMDAVYGTLKRLEGTQEAGMGTATGRIPGSVCGPDEGQP